MASVDLSEQLLAFDAEVPPGGVAMATVRFTNNSAAQTPTGEMATRVVFHCTSPLSPESPRTSAHPFTVPWDSAELLSLRNWTIPKQTPDLLAKHLNGLRGFQTLSDKIMLPCFLRSGDNGVCLEHLPATFTLHGAEGGETVSCKECDNTIFTSYRDFILHLVPEKMYDSMNIDSLLKEIGRFNAGYARK